MHRSAIRYSSIASTICPKKALLRMASSLVSMSSSWHEFAAADWQTGYTINKYLTSFARDFKLEELVTFESTVTEVDQTLSGAWILTLATGYQIECTKLIWAVGPGSSPVRPTWPKDNFSSPVIHSSDTGKNLGLISQAKSVTVVGAAKSAFDTAYFLTKAGKEVDWIIREDGGGPIAMGPPTLLGIWNTVDGLSTRSMAMFSPSIMNTSGFWYKAIHRTPIGRMVAGAYWRTANFLADYAAGYDANDDFKALQPTPRGSGYVKKNRRVKSAKR